MNVCIEFLERRREARLCIAQFKSKGNGSLEHQTSNQPSMDAAAETTEDRKILNNNNKSKIVYYVTNNKYCRGASNINHLRILYRVSNQIQSNPFLLFHYYK